MKTDKWYSTITFDGETSVDILCEQCAGDLLQFDNTTIELNPKNISNAKRCSCCLKEFSSYDRIDALKA